MGNHHKSLVLQF